MDEVQILPASGSTYRPGTLADLSGWIRAADHREQWRMVAEFLEEFRHEPPGERLALLQEEPPTTGDENWDAFLAGLAEHLAAKENRSGPAWCETRILPRFWFPFNTSAARVDAFVHAPAAFRRRGVFVTAAELEVA
nr:hypothetical protein [Streptomyces sp. 846.5]